MTSSHGVSRLSGPRRQRRFPVFVTAGVTVLALAACADGGSGNAAAGSSSSAPASSSAAQSSGPEDLSPGLLPADAFGPGASVTKVTAQQLQQGSGVGGQSMQDAQITPPACDAAVKSTQPPSGDLPGLVAQVAADQTTGATTIEVLAQGDGVTDAVSQMAEQIAACPQATVTTPQFTATITFTPLDVPDLGDGSAGISFTTALSTTGGQPVTVPALVAFAADGDRLVGLTTASQGAAPDPAAFTALLQKAFQAQADALD
jgi:hypothetical protein